MTDAKAALESGKDVTWEHPWGQVVLGRWDAGPTVAAVVGGRMVASWAWLEGRYDPSTVLAAMEEAARCGQRVAEYVAPEADDARAADDVGGEE